MSNGIGINYTPLVRRAPLVGRKSLDTISTVNDHRPLLQEDSVSLESMSMIVETVPNDYWSKFKAKLHALWYRPRPSEPLNSTAQEITVSCLRVQSKSLKSNSVTESVAEKNSSHGLRRLFGSNGIESTNNSNPVETLAQAVEPKKSMR